MGTVDFDFLSSQAERRESMMFTIDNTPKNSNILKKRLNKLRGSTRKYPGKSSKKLPAPANARKGQENTPSVNPRAGAGQTARAGSFKSPQVTIKGLRKSPQTTSRSAKSPGLTASARKVNKIIFKWFARVFVFQSVPLCCHLFIVRV